jgi:hypothetical protein
MESAFAAMPDAGDMAAVEEEEAREDGSDIAATQIQALASGGCVRLVVRAALSSGN